MQRVSAQVDSTNVASRRICMHLSFVPEARLAAAHDGGNLILYVMWRADRQFLED